MRRVPSPGPEISPDQPGRGGSAGHPTLSPGAAARGRRRAEVAGRDAPSPDAAAALLPGLRVLALVRLVHPFPSLLDAVATGALAVLAGGTPIAVATLAGSMLLLQLSIGATNDVVDAPADAVARPTKPIPAGLVDGAAARGVAVVTAVCGLGLAATLGPATLAVAAAGLAIGLAYDLRLKSTPLSWLPFAAGIALVPVYAWVGAAGEVPPAVLALALLAVPAGAGLAVSNALADLDGDRLAGVRTVATELGPARAWRVATGLLGGTIAVALAALVALGAGPWSGDATGARGGSAPDVTVVVLVAAWLALVGAALVVAAGVWASRGPTAARRRVGWGIEAVGLVVLGCGWLVALGAAGRLAAP